MIRNLSGNGREIFGLRMILMLHITIYQYNESLKNHANFFEFSSKISKIERAKRNSRSDRNFLIARKNVRNKLGALNLSSTKNIDEQSMRNNNKI